MNDQQRAVNAPGPSTAEPPRSAATEAVRNFWAKAFTYSGRATRSEYNWALALFVLYYAAVGGSVVGVGLRDTWLGVALALALLLVFIVPWFALVARRCHDMNRPGAFGLLLLATGIGFLITEGFLMFSDSDPRGARFDPVTLSTESVQKHSDLSR
jgi:uncharacterized membrane protein YhaH (DUF805 family)